MGNHYIWKDPPKQVCLELDEVHIWKVTLQKNRPFWGKLRCILSADEKERADTFFLKHDQLRFVAFRAILRVLLGRYLEIAPRQLRFRYNSHGKPQVISKFNGKGLNFNLAHSEDFALYAFCMHRNIGIDVEKIRAFKSTSQIVDRYFSEMEKNTFATLHEKDKLLSFWKTWVKKESFVKAKGIGLSYPLDQFSVSILPPSNKLKAQEYIIEKKSFFDWQIIEIAISPEYIGAFTIDEHKCYHVKYYQLSDNLNCIHGVDG